MLAAKPTLSAQATFQIPGPTDTPASLLDRWSNTHVSLPAAVAVPYDEGDLTALIDFAKQHKLSIVVAGGKHLTTVPVTCQTLYIDLKNFASVKLNEDASTVTVGGGATTGPVIEALASAGYYTAVPNTDSVGFVGAFLGGGSSGLNSITGFMVDHAVRIRIVTATGKTLELGLHSEGEEAALWHTLRGAGHGLGIVTEVTLRMYPLSNLNMDENKFWSRTMVFPPPAISIAARTFEKLQAIRGPIGLNLIVARSPPDSPMPDAPIIVLTASFFGPPSKSEAALDELLAPEVINNAVVANTSLIPVHTMNSGTKAIERRGGFKRSEGTLLQEIITASTIERSFARFVQLGADAPDTMRSGVVFFAFDSTVLQAQGRTEEAQRSFFNERNTRCIVYHDVWFNEDKSAPMVDTFIADSTAIIRSSEVTPLRRFANFLQHPANMAETYSEAKIAEKLRVKQLWDPENLFWTPGM
ncbi:6-hydroxy-D-nicotine oxidase [Paramyrothecium foliicola]|nr:6-hydroxy-D-nicotine oxidase [Paramyrothecium foliicola]